MKTIVMIDSAADISIEDEKKLNVPTARFAITIEGKEYIDEIDINLDSFKDYLDKGVQMSTSQASIGVLMEMWDNLLKEYDEVIYLTLSKGLSGSYASAYALSQEYNGKVTVIDGNLVAHPIQIAYHAVNRYLEEGKTSAEIKDIIENHEPMYAFIIPHDINHLKRGGRISAQAAALANLLKITPILVYENGVIDAHDRVRTHKKALSKAVDQIIAKYDQPDDYHFYILHADLDESAEEYKVYMEDKLNTEVIVRNLHPLILTHTGPKTFAVGAIKKY